MLEALRHFARFTIAWSVFLLLAAVAVASVGGNVIEEATGEAEVEVSEYLVAPREDEAETAPTQPFAFTRTGDLQRARHCRLPNLMRDRSSIALPNLNGTGAFLRL